LPVGIDGQIAPAEGRPVEVSASETVRLAVLIQPPRQPLHLEGQGEFVHVLRFAMTPRRYVASPANGAEAATSR
jgi:hypothetical protein